MQNVLVDILAEPIGKDSFLTKDKIATESLARDFSNDFTIMNLGFPHIRFSAYNEYNLCIRVAYSEQLPYGLGNIKAELYDCEKSIASKFSIRTNFRFWQLQLDSTEGIPLKPDTADGNYER